MEQLSRWLLNLRFLTAATIAVASLQAEGDATRAAAADGIGGSRRLTLQDCYRLALELSEQDQIRAENLKAAEARYRQSLAAYFPQFSLFAAPTWQDRIEQDRRRQQAEDAIRLLAPAQQSQLLALLPARESDAQGTNPYVGGVALSWPLFSGFRTLHESRALQQERQALEFERQRSRELLYQDLAEVYYQALMYAQILASLDSEQTALKERIAELRARVRLGRSRQGDLLQAESDLAQNRVEAELQRGLARATTELLGFLIGRTPADTRLAPASDPPAPENIAAYLEHTGERSDLLQAAAALRAARQRSEVASGEHWPQASLQGEYYLRQRPDSSRDWRVTLRIDLPLFSGGATAARVDEAAARLRGSELDLDRLRRLSDYEVRASYSDFSSAAARLLLLREAAALARANYNVQVRDYRLGIVTNLEALSALTRVFVLERSIVQTEMQTRLASIRLQIAAGRSPP
ncbi:MAG: TolC family protein [Leptospirales bacterium]|nr:TolC family protein [Leptospirales bacterium]